MTRELLVWTHIKTNGHLHFTLCLEFKAADMWIGAYWTHRKNFPMTRWTRTDVWLCIVPMLPIHLTLYLPMRRVEGATKGDVA